MYHRRRSGLARGRRSAGRLEAREVGVPLQRSRGPYKVRTPESTGALHRDRPASSRLTAGAVYGIAFLTGAAGLIYEISWSRQIGLLFGYTAQAAAIVLSSYFAGMALGYSWAGRWAARLARPLRGYAFAELVVAAWATAIPSVLSAFEGSSLASLANSENLTIQGVTRALSAFIVLLPATVALGATLPFIAQSIASRDSSLGRVNAAYALNMAGGVVGVVSATAVLLVVAGVRNSGYIAAGISALCGALAWSISGQVVATGPPVAAATDRSSKDPRRHRWLVLAIVSGFGVLCLEVLYTHLLALVFHNSTYTFGLVLTCCLLALAAGAALARPVSRMLGSDRAIGDVCILTSAAIPVSVIAFVAITRFQYFTFGSGLVGYLGGALGLTMLVAFPPMTIAGMLLPMAWRGELGPGGAGRAVGRLTAANTLAGSLGALVTSFIALPLLGVWGAFALVAVVYLVTWLAVGRGQAHAGRWAFGLSAACVVILGVIAPRSVHTVKNGQELVRHWDSAYGWVDVIHDTSSGYTWMRRDAQHILGSTEDYLAERRQAFVPLLLHPMPHHVLFVGLGTGITAGAALADPTVADVTTVELIPRVADAARLFAQFNEDVLDAPRAKVVINDGRHFLKSTSRRFDVIVSDIFVPWESQTGYLYTVEHYRSARDRLAPGGLYCQWLATWQLRAPDVLMIADSFAAVFPRVSVWFADLRPGFVVMALVGSEQPISIDADELAPRIGRFNGARGAVGSVEELRSLYAGEWLTLGVQALNTDEHPRIEFLAPRAQFDMEQVLVMRTTLLQALSPRLKQGVVNDHTGSR